MSTKTMIYLEFADIVEEESIDVDKDHDIPGVRRHRRR
jgi:hypothetical protein